MRAVALFVAAMIAGNLGILGAHLWMRHSSTAAAAPAASSAIRNFAQVDARLWRGAAPSAVGYEALAAAGVTTIVDLRAEAGIRVDESRLDSLGIRRVHLPMRDGQAPSAALVERFLDVVNSSSGPTFVHCGAGVGRTGTMAAAYLVQTGQTTGREAVRRNLAVGPPSLEQVVFGLRMQQGGARSIPPAAVAISRTLDAPRRVLVHLRGSYTRGGPDT